MFKKSLILSSFVCFSMLGIAGCSNQDAEYKIATLKEENTRLARQVHALQATLDSLNAHKEAVDHSLKSLDMK
jgi:outer membrane murein-binding lipoprotein Lpp